VDRFSRLRNHFKGCRTWEGGRRPSDFWRLGNSRSLSGRSRSEIVRGCVGAMPPWSSGSLQKSTSGSGKRELRSEQKKVSFEIASVLATTRMNGLYQSSIGD